jgi:hypothetical protein
MQIKLREKNQQQNGDLENQDNRQGFDKLWQAEDLEYIKVEQKMIIAIAGEFYAPLEQAPVIARSFQKWLLMWKLDEHRD